MTRHTYTPQFETFWSWTPVAAKRCGKLVASRKYDIALSHIGTDALLTACKAWRGAVAQKDPQFVEMASTWLNQGRWSAYLPEAPPDTTLDDTPATAQPDGLTARSRVNGMLSAEWQVVTDALLASRMMPRCWIQCLTLTGINSQQRPILQADTRFSARWISDNFQPTIERLWKRPVVVQ